MKEIRELTDKLFEYTKTISISECELYDNYYDFMSDMYKSNIKQDTLHKIITKSIKADLLYDLLYDTDKIKQQLVNDLGVYEPNSMEYEDIKNMYIEIKKQIKNFIIEELE